MRKCYLHTYNLLAISDDLSSSAMCREHGQVYMWKVFYLWFQFSSFPTPALFIHLPLRTSWAKPDKLIRNYIQHTLYSFVSLPPASLILHVRDHCSWSFLAAWCWGFKSNPLLLEEECFSSNLSTFSCWYQWVDHLEFKKWEKKPFYSQITFVITRNYTFVVLGQGLVSVSCMWRCLFWHHLLKYIHLAVPEQLLIQAFNWTRIMGEYLKLMHTCFLEFYPAGTSVYTSRWRDNLLQVHNKWMRSFSAVICRRLVCLFLQS